MQLTDRQALAKVQSQKRVAKELSFVYVDTGAMYRAMGIYFSDLGIAPEEQEKIEAACKDVKISISYENGEQQVY